MPALVEAGDGPWTARENHSADFRISAWSAPAASGRWMTWPRPHGQIALGGASTAANTENALSVVGAEARRARAGFEVRQAR